MAEKLKNDLMSRYEKTISFLVNVVSKREKAKVQSSFPTPFNITIDSGKKIANLINKIYKKTENKLGRILFIKNDYNSYNIMKLQSKTLCEVFFLPDQEVTLWVYEGPLRENFIPKTKTEPSCFSPDITYLINNTRVRSFIKSDFKFYNDKSTSNFFNLQKFFLPNSTFFLHDDLKTFQLTKENKEEIKEIQTIKLDDNEITLIPRAEVVLDSDENVGNLFYFFEEMKKEENKETISLYPDRLRIIFTEYQFKEVYKKLGGLVFKELQIDISPLSFERSIKMMESLKILYTELISINYHHSYPDQIRQGDSIKDAQCLVDIFRLTTGISANYLSLTLKGMRFSAKNGKDLEKKCWPWLTNLCIIDDRNEFTNPEYTKAFLCLLKNYSNIVYLEKLVLKDMVIYDPEFIVILSDFIKQSKNLKVLYFENIGIKMNLSLATKHINKFHDEVNELRLRSLVFQNFPILNIKFIQNFTKALDSNPGLVFEFDNSMIHREFDYIALKAKTNGIIVKLTSYFNTCYCYENLDLRDLFLNLREIKFSNFQIGGNIFDKHSKLFKSILYSYVFQNKLNKASFENCDGNDFNYLANLTREEKDYYKVKFDDDSKISKLKEFRLVYHITNTKFEEPNLEARALECICYSSSNMNDKEHFNCSNQLRRVKLKEFNEVEIINAISRFGENCQELVLKNSFPCLGKSIKKLFQRFKKLTLSRYSVGPALEWENGDIFLCEDLTLKFITGSILSKHKEFSNTLEAKLEGNSSNLPKLLNNFPHLETLRFKCCSYLALDNLQNLQLKNLRKVEIDYETFKEHCASMAIKKENYDSTISKLINNFSEASCLGLDRYNVLVDGRPISILKNALELKYRIERSGVKMETSSKEIFSSSFSGRITEPSSRNHGAR